jgi:hypothetical protein
MKQIRRAGAIRSDDESQRYIFLAWTRMKQIRRAGAIRSDDESQRYIFLAWTRIHLKERPNRSSRFLSFRRFLIADTISRELAKL